MKTLDEGSHMAVSKGSSQYAMPLPTPPDHAEHGPVQHSTVSALNTVAFDSLVKHLADLRTLHSTCKTFLACRTSVNSAAPIGCHA